MTFLDTRPLSLALNPILATALVWQGGSIVDTEGHSMTRGARRLVGRSRDV